MELVNRPELFGLDSQDLFHDDWQERARFWLIPYRSPFVFCTSGRTHQHRATACMSTHGEPLRREIVIPSDLAAARQLQSEIEQALTAVQFPEAEIFAIRMAVEEALVNAIKHGNQMDQDKNVRVVYQIGPERFEVRITDQGPGFDPTDVPDPTAPENLERPCGRGLLLIRYYMTDVTFDDKGSTIAMFKLRNGTR
jgi:serine/threonine-protein kinase RsbW